MCIPHSDKAQGWGEPFVLGRRKLLEHTAIKRETVPPCQGCENNCIIKAAWTIILHLPHILDLHILSYILDSDEEKSTDIFSVFKRNKSYLTSGLLTTNMG